MAFLDKNGLVHLWNHMVARLSTKVEAENGKGLSTNDYTDEDKNKLNAMSVDVDVLSSLVGNTPVSEQINTALDGMDLTAYETKDDSALKFDEAKSYADSVGSTVKNDLLNGAGEAYDTLKELGDLINVNVDAIDALEIVASGKADKEHTHDIYETKEDAQLKYNTLTTGKADSVHGHDVATISTNGFMSADMVTKLNNIEAGANQTIVDNAFSSSSTNPVQNKVVNEAIGLLNSSISTNTSSINSHTEAISNLQTAVNSIQEITSQEIQTLFA